ncbi:unnamed protein product [Rodentolepis nana]|uniref:Uncharacterized protein n=1 Tax=Rodentolepis nana TaxID=102285 RepID=A0A0R3TMA8_RODNA|nr:unnamed protein product [Rodentolepis nana]
MEDEKDEIPQKNFYLTTDERNNEIAFLKYKRGERIVDWLMETKQKIFQHKWTTPIKAVLLNSLDESAREYAFSEGLCEDDSFNDICKSLEEIFRYDGRLPTLLQLYNKSDDIYTSNEARATEIFCRTKAILLKRDSKELVEETALHLFIHTLRRELAEELLKFEPRTLQEALQLYPKALERYYANQVISIK